MNKRAIYLLLMILCVSVITLAGRDCDVRVCAKSKPVVNNSMPDLLSPLHLLVFSN